MPWTPSSVRCSDEPGYWVGLGERELMKRRRVVRVPASSANLGPGFDIFALALELENELHKRVVGQDEAVHEWVWITDLDVTEANVRAIMRAGRARWKVENETFNTLKNQGYHFEHNFGHGEQQLSVVFACLMMLERVNYLISAEVPLPEDEMADRIADIMFAAFDLSA